VVALLMVGPIEFAAPELPTMAIGLHSFDRHLTRSYAPSMFGIKHIPLLFRMATTTDASVGLPTWSLTTSFPIRRKADAVVHDECSCGQALNGNTSVYNEEAFRYLLDIERKRFEVFSQPFVLVLTDFARQAGHSDAIPAGVSSRIFSTLASTLRDTDVIGWYREERVIGTILTHLGDAPLGETTKQMSARVKRALSAQLPEDLGHLLKVRLYRPRARMVVS
jgi:hypothetical protein